MAKARGEEAGTFRAKFDSWCAVCRCQIWQGDICHYAVWQGRKRVVHKACWWKVTK